MKIEIDTVAATLRHSGNGSDTRTLNLYSKEAFELLSHQWVRVGWDQRYSYNFTWLGRPIIQLPEDMIRAQEVIWRVKPDVVIETGVAHGGSLIFYASLLKLMGKGRVIGVDIEIRPQNRTAIEQHPLGNLITLVEGSSIDPSLIQRLRSMVHPGEKVMVFLDSAHNREHVMRELETYQQFVSPDSYLVATDGVMKDLHDVPRGKPDWKWDNPYDAAAEFVRRNGKFVLEQPDWPFRESELTQNITYWPGAWLRRLAQPPAR